MAIVGYMHVRLAREVMGNDRRGSRATYQYMHELGTNMSIRDRGMFRFIRPCIDISIMPAYNYMKPCHRQFSKADD